MSLFILFEHAAGYALFRVKEFEEIGVAEKQVEANALELKKFNSVVKLIAFMPFTTAANALDNINSISEGILHNDLQEFLETNLPKPGKKEKITLGVGDPKIGAAISEIITVSCQHTGVVPEILRGIRYHFPNLIKGFTSESADKAQLGLGHSYSRAKVKFNVNRVDNMIIQSISLLDQLDKDINTFSMRIREWYSYHFPELIKIVPDNYTYARVAQYIQNRKELNEDKLEGLEEIVMDSSKAQAILDASRSSMGMDISPIDLINIESFSRRVISLSEYRKKLHEYLKEKMSNIAPSLSALIGEQVGARLISHAGSLTNLAKYPASTVQILGAEKALFRALKTRSNTPKYGLIFHSTFIGRAAIKNKGRISRFLANKCSIASRIDCFSDMPTPIFGEHLRQQVEDRLKFFENGEAPKKNIDVMKEAITESVVFQASLLKKKKKKERKERKQKLQELDPNESVLEGMSQLFKEDKPVKEESSIKKKKKRSKKYDLNASAVSVDALNNLFEGEQMNDVSLIKKKRKHMQEANFNEGAAEDKSNLFEKEPIEKSAKKKKRKSKDDVTQEFVVNGIQEIEMNESLTKKKKKKKKSHVQDNDI